MPALLIFRAKEESMSIQLSLLPISGDLQHPEKIPAFSGDLQHPEKISTNSDNEQRLEQQLAKLQRFLNKGKPRDGSGSIQIYNKSHNKGNYSYYHYSYWNGKRTKNKHICGGKVGNSKVESRVKIIKQALAREASVAEILNLIAAFK